jgi:tRNA-2-methylthio-N6-dimethylallyladenosine synthase
MKRGYTREEYRDLIHHVRDTVPDAAIHSDVIVGFPAETREQFQKTYDILRELRLDKVHLARYSPRPGTVSARRMADDVPDAEKRRRFHAIESLQKEILQEEMRHYVGQTVEVLVEDKLNGRWRGRNPQNKLVFFTDPGDQRGKLVQVFVRHAGPWSMSGTMADESSRSTKERGNQAEDEVPFSATIPLTVL